MDTEADIDINSMSTQMCADILAIPPDATFEVIRKAFKLKARQWHPDKHPKANKEKAERMFKRVLRAYEVLTSRNKGAGFVEDVFEEFFTSFFRKYSENENDGDDDDEMKFRAEWGTAEARANRMKKRKHLWDQEDAMPEEERNKRMSRKVFDYKLIKSWAEDDRQLDARSVPSFFSSNTQINSRIAIYAGSILNLNVDAICNSTDPFLSGGGGVDYAVHQAAGYWRLAEEMMLLDGCPPGQAEITRGYNLPAKYIIHCVGPSNQNATTLASCYHAALDLAIEHGIRTIAFPCVATGVFGFPIQAAAQIAMQTVRRWLEIGDHISSIDKIIFVMYRPSEEVGYLKWITSVFPLPASLSMQETLDAGDEGKVKAIQQWIGNEELMDPWLSKHLKGSECERD